MFRADGGPEGTPRITSLLIKLVSAVCNLDCAYCFYLDRERTVFHRLGEYKFIVGTRVQAVGRPRA